MIGATDVTEAQILARAVGVLLSAGGAICLLFFFLMFGVVREEREKGNLEAASRVRRNVFITLSLGMLSIASGAALYFFA
ncbi:hypothetical protein [Streptomyces atratus]|uniref:hypothetical protein n=1 Tax=Streptomyces atratus TaxID=1893 RepID=UPI0033F5CE4D